MKISGTNLEYSEADEVVLDYALGGHSETKEQWAQRVTTKCAEYQATEGKGYDNQGMSSCYSQTPEYLWENKKIKRREAMVKDLKGPKLNQSESDFVSVLEKHTKDGKRMQWSNSHCDAEVIKLKDHANYKKAFDRHLDKQRDQALSESKAKIDRENKYRALFQKGFDDETIRLICPTALRPEDVHG